jgi:hypothetical protein
VKDGFYHTDEIGDKPGLEGHYLMPTHARPAKWQAVETKCPLCTDALAMPIPQPVGRVARVVGRHDGNRTPVIGDRVPAGIVVLGCRACEVVFTTPTSSLPSAPKEP